MSTNNPIETFLGIVSSYLYKIPDKVIENYILDEFELPVHLTWRLDYEVLKNYHNQATNLFNSYRDDPEYSEELKRLIRIRAHLSMHILLHPSDRNSYGTSKFEVSDQSFLNQLPLKTSNGLQRVKKLYRIITAEGRIDKISRKLFISLLFDNDPQDEKILWNDSEADLRGFLTAIIDLNFVKYDTTDLNKFASKNFKCLNRKKLPKHIKQDTFKGLQSKVSFTKARIFWNDRLNQLR